MSAEAKDKTEHLTYKLTSVEMTTPCDGTYSFADATAGVGSWEIDNKSSKEYSYADALPLSFSETGSAKSGSTYWNILPVTDGKILFKVGYRVFQNGKMIAEFSEPMPRPVRLSVRISFPANAMCTISCLPVVRKMPSRLQPLS